jgi:hemolysin-activating ACP:hemolysin acyltransferase
MACTDTNDCQTQLSLKLNTNRECCGTSGDHSKDQLPAQVSDLRKRTAESKSLHASFGEVVNLLTHTAEFENLPLFKLKSLVLPAIRKGQFAILEGRDETNNITAPIAVMLWANVSEEIDRRLSNGSSSRASLSADEWSSGEIPWLVLAIGDTNLLSGLKAHVEKAVNGGRPFKYKPLLGRETYA